MKKTTKSTAKPTAKVKVKDLKPKANPKGGEHIRKATLTIRKSGTNNE